MTIGRLFGVRIVLNRYFLGLLLVFGLAGLLQQAAAAFGIVFLHEFAHVLAARLRKLTVSEVELLPFGGVARIGDGLEIDPATEILVALAGPVCNLLLAGAAWAAHRWSGALSFEWSSMLIAINAAIGGFNLLPALPLDGGRVLRAALSRRIGFGRATRRAAAAGKVIAVALAVVGALLVGAGVANATLVAVALFVYWAAREEEQLAAYSFLRSLARRGNLLRRAGLLPARHLAAVGTTPVKEVLLRLVPQAYHVVWVFDGSGELVGMATEAELIRVAFRSGMETPVERAARPLKGG